MNKPNRTYYRVDADTGKVMTDVARWLWDRYWDGATRNLHRFRKWFRTSEAAIANFELYKKEGFARAAAIPLPPYTAAQEHEFDAYSETTYSTGRWAESGRWVDPIDATIAPFMTRGEDCHRDHITAGVSVGGYIFNRVFYRSNR